MQPNRLATNTRDFVAGDEAQQAIAKAVKTVRELATAAYGPRSGNVAIESVYGDPITSHDGVFNLDHLHLPDPSVNIAARALIQSSKQTNVRVGDGTTAASVLACALYDDLKKLVADGVCSRMEAAKRLERASAKAIEYVESLKITATPELLQAAAIISASDEDLGMLISDTIQAIGADGGVIIENFNGTGMYNDIVNGFYFRKGFTEAALLTDPSNLESRFDDVAILVTAKELSSVQDMVTILDKCVGANVRELLLIGSVKTGALEQAIRSRLDGHIITTIVDTPVHAAMRTLFLDDVALYTGAKVLSAGATTNDFELSMLGEAKAVVNEFSTTILGGDGDKEQIAARAAELSAQLKTASNPIEQTVLRERLGRLTGKIAILRVGGSTPIEQQEKKFKVEDAVAALQAAIKEGVVPGGGVTLARMPEDVGFKHAFEQPLLALLSNVGRNADRGLWHVQQAKDWQGYDLRSDDGKLVNLEKTGVVDPTLVIKEVILNGASAAANLIKTTVLLPFDNREAKRG